MKKSIFILCFTALVFLSSWNIAGAESNYLFWDFSQTADKYDGLKLTPKNGTAEIEDGELKISYSSGNSPEVHFLLDKEYGAIDTAAVIEFDYKTEAESVNIYLQNSPLGGSVFRLKQNTVASLRATYEESAGAKKNTNTVIKNDLVQGQWYNIKFILDYAEEKCSIEIDGEAVLENVCLFYNSGGLTDSFYDVLIGPDKAGTVYIDNLAVYETDSISAFLNVRSELLTVPETAEENLELVKGIRDGISVEWSSSDETVISPDGTVTFPSMSEGDKTVELSAVLSKDGESITRKYTVNVPARLSDTEAIELAISEISVDEKIYDDYKLPVSAENDVIIDWNADKTEWFIISDISTDGFYNVTTSRQPTDEIINLTAEFSRGDKSIQKVYTVMLAKLMTDRMCVDEDIAVITLPETVKENFSLPLNGVNSTDITWTSKNEEFIVINENLASVVCRDTVDKAIILVAKVTKGSETAEKEFTVTVEKDIEGNTLLLNEALKALDLGSVSGLTSDISLPLSGINGTVISWSSSDEGVITSSGKITRASNTRSANLIATVTKGTLSDEKVFRITVSGKGSGGSGGSGGGSSSSGSRPSTTVSLPSSKVPVKDNSPIEIKPKFSDVVTEHWAFEYIEKLANEGVIDGDENGRFNPQAYVKREEFVKMLIEAVSGEAEYENIPDFADVPSTEWYAKYIYSAYEKGYISGMGDGMFGTGEYILREQIAVILYRVLGINQSGELTFTDKDSISDYAKEAVNVMKTAGIINGDDDGNFRPKSPATRAETAKLIYEVVKGE